MVAPGQQVLNKPEAIMQASCKLRTFEAFKAAGVPCPEFWTPANVANAKRKDSIIIARLTTRGSGGEGIVVVREADALPKAPLYTNYIRKLAEYRVHVMRNTVLMVQQKRRDSEAEQTDDQKLIRNHDNGWVFAAVNVEFSSDEQKAKCEQAAVSAVRSLGLDFGAVDLVVSKRDGNPYVLEVNTAPGIQSPTLLERYVTSIQEIARGITYERPEPKRVVRPRNLR
jgi:glutathione synthase/RimK-type ligase-like ATP-grasp enzyme